MVTKRISVKLCDSCGKQTETTHVRITVQGERGMLGDLCDDCMKPIRKVLAAVSARRLPRVAVADLQVVNAEDIPKLVRKAARTSKRAPETAGNAPLAREQKSRG